MNQHDPVEAVRLCPRSSIQWKNASPMNTIYAITHGKLEEALLVVRCCLLSFRSSRRLDKVNHNEGLLGTAREMFFIVRYIDGTCLTAHRDCFCVRRPFVHPFDVYFGTNSTDSGCGTRRRMALIRNNSSFGSNGLAR